MRFGVDARKSERRNLHIAFMRRGFAQLFSNELRQAVGVLRPAWVDFIDRQIIRGALPDWIVESIDRQARSANDFLDMASLRRRQDIVGNRHVLIEPLRIAGDVGKFPLLRCPR